MREPSHPWFDTRQAPLYVITAPPRLDDALLQSMIDGLGRWYQTLDHPIAYVLDLSALEQTTAAQRHMVTESDKKMRAIDFKWNRGQAYVVNNVLIRGVVSVIWLVQPPAYPHSVFTQREKAIVWAKERLGGTPSATVMPRSY